MKSMMSNHDTNSKGLESSSGQTGANDDIIIKVEPVETCSSTSASPEISQAISTGHSEPYHQLSYPSMVSRQLRRYPSHSQKQHSDQEIIEHLPQNKVAFDYFKNQILGSIKLEFPNATDEEAYHIAAKRWDMLSEEQKRSFMPKGVQLDGRGSNLSMSRLRGVHYDVAGSEEDSNYGNDRNATKYGKCTWCHRFGTLNDYSSNLQGREIYCTGLCSKDCFEQAALKILNVEAGYGLESSSFPESVPIRTSLENISHDSRDRRKQPYEQLQYDSVSRMDATRYRSARGCDAVRPFSVVPTSPTSLPFPTTPSIVPMWNVENVKSLNRTERARPSKQENQFQWNEYIRRTGSTVAPLSCFRQQQSSGPNLFQIGMKLELKNPKDESNYCLATVINVVGPRLHLYLDGCPNRDEIWLLYDSCELHPVGWCKENGLELKQPKGFSIEGEAYTEFVQRTLKDAKRAPLSAFQDEPAPPKENGFSPGMKLEAVNKVYPSVVGVATVLDVDEDRIRIEFDGYKGSGYWTTYLDRDLFNAGWCFANGHPLRPPASSVIRLEGINPYNEISRSPFRCERNYQQMPNAGEVDVHINNGCYPGPYLDPKKISSLPSTYTGHIGVVLKNILEDLIRCAHHQKTVLGFLKPGRGSIVISAVSDGMAYNFHLSNVDRVSTFWKVMEQFCDNLRCCSNLVSGFHLQSTCPQCDRGPLAKKKDIAKSSQKRLSTEQLDTPTCISSTPDSTAATTAEYSSTKGFASLESPKRRRIYSAISKTATSPRTWSVDDVARLVEKTDLKDYVNLFRENDIDGTALLLLQRDIVINYMGLKIGPAVKLLDLIEDVKEMDSRFS